MFVSLAPERMLVGAADGGGGRRAGDGGDRRPPARRALRGPRRGRAHLRDGAALRGGVPPLGAVDPADGDRRAGVRARPARAIGPPPKRAIEAALATGEDRAHVEAAPRGTSAAGYHVVAGRPPGPRSAASTPRWTSCGANPGATHVFPGEWALLRTVLDDDGDAARAEVAALAGRHAGEPQDAPPRRGGRRRPGRPDRGGRGDASPRSTTGSPRPPTRHRRAYLRQLVAPAAHADGWGDPIAWLRESLATFEANDHDALAARCRTLLKDARRAGPPQGPGRHRRRPAGARRPRHHQPGGRRPRPGRRGRHQPRGGRAALHLPAHRRQARRAPPPEGRHHPGRPGRPGRAPAGLRT